MQRRASRTLVFLGTALLLVKSAASPSLSQDKSTQPRQVITELVGQPRQAHGPLGLALSGDYSYLAAWRRGLRIVNVSNPKEPREIGNCQIQGTVRDVVVVGGYAYVAAMDGGLRVLDLARQTGSCWSHSWRERNHPWRPESCLFGRSVVSNALRVPLPSKALSDSLDGHAEAIAPPEGRR